MANGHGWRLLHLAIVAAILAPSVAQAQPVRTWGGVPTPPATNLGHFHIDNDEFWFILEGRCDYLIEKVGLITADAGDIVFVPPGRWHRASWALGKSGAVQMDTRMGVLRSPTMQHNYGPDANGTQ